MLICNALQYLHQKFVARVVTDYLKGITNEKGISAAISADARILLKYLHEIRDEMNSFPKLAKENSIGFLENAPPDFSWANAYSISMLEMLASLIVLAGLTEKIKEIPKENFASTNCRWRRNSSILSC